MPKRRGQTPSGYVCQATSQSITELPGTVSGLYPGSSTLTPTHKGPSTRRGPFPLEDPGLFLCAWEEWRRQGRDGGAAFTRWNQRAGRVKPLTPARKSPGQAFKRAPRGNAQISSVYMDRSWEQVNQPGSLLLPAAPRLHPTATPDPAAQLRKLGVAAGPDRLL